MARGGGSERGTAAGEGLQQRAAEDAPRRGKRFPQPPVAVARGAQTNHEGTIGVEWRFVSLCVSAYTAGLAAAVALMMLMR